MADPVPPNHPGAGRSAHLIGVCGSGMKALAEWLTDSGWTVSGSDNRPDSATREALRSRGVVVRTGHAAANLPDACSLVVHSPAVPDNNIELRVARSRGIDCVSYPRMLGRIMADSCGVAVAGTHGKSTTTALIGWILQRAGRRPSVLVGAEFADTGRNGWAGTGDVVVMESCEYRRGFLELSPARTVLLGIEADHFDSFDSLESMTETFRLFAARTRGGPVYLNADCPHTIKIPRNLETKTVLFGRSTIAHWRATQVQVSVDGLTMRISAGGREAGRASVPLVGTHHVTNALAAVCVCAEMGVDIETILQALTAFPGLRRRFEVAGEYCGVTLVDDYAHHPTAIRAVLRAARRRFPGRRLVAVFEPHQLSRTIALFDDFAAALREADSVFLAPIFTAREDANATTCHETLQRLQAVVDRDGPPTTAAQSLETLISTLDDAMRPGDVCVTMGAGNVDRIRYEFLGRFQRHSAAG